MEHKTCTVSLQMFKTTSDHKHKNAQDFRMSMNMSWYKTLDPNQTDICPQLTTNLNT